MKLKLNKIVFFLLILCTFATLFEFIQYAILFEFIQYATLFKFIQYSPLFKVPKCATYQKTLKKNIQKNKTLETITFNHLLHRLSRLGCPR